MNTDNITTKKCTTCLIEKEFKYFYKSKKGKHGIVSACKDCSVEYTTEHHRTKHGLITRIYLDQKRNSKVRGHKSPEYNLCQLKDWIYSQHNFDSLYKNWILSDYKKSERPSCDRLNDYKPYTLDNLRIVTWFENNQRLVADKINGVNRKQSVSVLKKDLNGKVIKEYYSMASASRDTKINAGGICKCCKRINETAGGFMWSYA